MDHIYAFVTAKAERTGDADIPGGRRNESYAGPERGRGTDSDERRDTEYISVLLSSPEV